MKKFWKLMAVALALCLMVTGCGGAGEEGEEAPSSQAETEMSNEEEETSQAPSEEEGEKGDAAAIYEAGLATLEDGILKVGTCADFPPFEFYEKNEMVGIDVDIVKAIGEKMGAKVEFQDMDFKAILASINGGKIDAGVAAISVTEDRKKSVDFSAPYTQTILKILVAKDSPIEKPEDLTGKKIGTQLGTTGEAYAKDDFGEENVQSFNKYNDAVMALSNGKVDAVIIDGEPAKNYAEAADLKLLDTAYAEEEYSIAFGKGKEDLVLAVNTALEELKADGTIKSIQDKYIGE